MIEELAGKVTRRRVLTAGELSTRTPWERIEGAEVDLFVLYHTAELEIARIGGLLPIESSNGLVLSMCEKIPVQKLPAPVFAGVCGTEPVQHFPRFFRRLAETGVSGVQNFPTVGLIDGQYRYNLESVDIGAKQEAESLQLARESGLQILPFAFNQYEALAMAKAGARIVILDLGLRPRVPDIREEIRQYLERIQSVGALVHLYYPQVKVLVYSMYQEVERRLERLQMDGADGLYRSVAL